MLAEVSGSVSATDMTRQLVCRRGVGDRPDGGADFEAVVVDVVSVVVSVVDSVVISVVVFVDSIVVCSAAFAADDGEVVVGWGVLLLAAVDGTEAPGVGCGVEVESDAITVDATAVEAPPRSHGLATTASAANFVACS